MLLVHSSMLGFGGYVHGPGWDEGGHLPAGIGYWQIGNTDLYRVNPPLVRSVATLPLSFIDSKLTWSWNSIDTRDRPEWRLGVQFFREHGKDAYWYLSIARLSCIPWSLLAAWTIFQWSRELWGLAGAWCSVLLWCFSPLVLTNAQMITPDTGASALGVATMYLFWKWMRHASFSQAVTTGIFLGLANSAKFTWIILFVLLPVIAVGTWWWVRSRRRQNREAKDGNNAADAKDFGDGWALVKQLATMIVLAVAVVNTLYGFEGIFRPLGQYEFVSDTLSGNDLHGRTGPTGNRFQDSILGKIPVPFASNYVLGIDRQKLDFETGFPSYINGQWLDEGRWYYYIYGVLIKEPLGFLCLFLVVVGLSIRFGLSVAETYLLAPALLIFVLVSSQTGFNHHIRYVMPAFPFVMVWCGKALSPLVIGVWKRRGIAFMIATSIGASCFVFPHSHAFFNLAVGGPMRGHDYLLDSNIDWGQDILLLSKWVEDNPERPIDGIAYSLDWLIDLQAIGLTTSEPPSGIKAAVGPQPGRYAVFVRPLRENPKLQYFLKFDPTEVLGYTVYIYEISEHDVERYRSQLDSAE